MKFGVAVFPGTWSDTDCFHVIKNVFHQDVEYVWHKETDLSSYDCIIIPGVGAFKDAMASLNNSGLAEAIKDVSKLNKPIVGLCLGMQLLLTESYEFGWHKGLDIITGDVVKLQSKRHDILGKNMIFWSYFFGKK